jgi:hypothetical protein
MKDISDQISATRRQEEDVQEFKNFEPWVRELAGRLPRSLRSVPQSARHFGRDDNIGKGIPETRAHSLCPEHPRGERVEE